ncbi:5851_t:CDS:2 [Funneliformis mosseae]|uniref:5851_t:CDS:1 n=1 Tax=Funneliformis mosseae TaxID=27381 RepID=A0A9N8V434_FUNMO|nr:5851_t:CDS:2 [Funneliformis mosseae]
MLCKSIFLTEPSGLLEPSELSEPLELLGSLGSSTPSGSLESLKYSTSMMSFRRKSVELLSRKLTNLIIINNDFLLYNVHNNDPDSLSASKEFFLLSKVP